MAALQAEMAKSSNLDNWIWSKIDECEMPANLRNRLAGAAYTTVLYHNQATLRLIDASMLPTAFALVRVLFEAIIVGLWVENCATDDELTCLVQTEWHPKIDRMISRIEEVQGFDAKIISRIKASNWKAQSDYTHCGGRMLQIMMSADGIETNFLVNETLEVLRSAAAWSLFAFLGIARLCDNLAVQNDILKRSRVEAG